MKFLATFCIAAIMVCQVIAAPTEDIAEAPVEVPREQRSYGAPAPSYAPAAPVYSAPPRLGPSRSYSYQSPAPTIPCGQALVFSCAPSVAQAPCAAAPTYAAAPSYGGGY